MQKQNPPVSPGGLEKILLAPYPHDSGHMQQHVAPAVEGQNM